MTFTYFGNDARAFFPYSVLPGITHNLRFTIQDFRNTPIRVSAVETIDGIDRELGSLIGDHVGEFNFDFTPHTGTVNIVFTKSTPSVPDLTWTLVNFRIGHWEYVPQNTYVQICNTGVDKYEFGFNGQMKTNEIAGTGNHNTAVFWEYDTRLARRWNLDSKSNPWESRYSVMGGNPILNKDVLGDKFLNGHTGTLSMARNDRAKAQEYYDKAKDKYQSLIDNNGDKKEIAKARKDLNSKEKILDKANKNYQDELTAYNLTEAALKDLKASNPAWYKHYDELKMTDNQTGELKDVNFYVFSVATYYYQ